MGDAFDPYHVWLGIPPGEQPPHHYRLLAIALFEGSPEVIENAAERQMSHVRRAAHGKHSEESQRILNEIAAAQRALLDAGRKAKYDEQLREKLTPQARAAAQTIEYTPPAAAIAAPPRAAAPPVKWKRAPEKHVEPPLAAPTRIAPSPLRGRAKQRFPVLLLVVLALAAILPVLALVAALAMSTGEPAIAAGDDADVAETTGGNATGETVSEAPPPGDSREDLPQLPQPGKTAGGAAEEERDPFDNSASFGRTSGAPKLEQSLTISARTLLPRLAFFSLPAEARTPIEVKAGQIVKLKIDGAWRIGPGGDQVRGIDALYIAVGHPGQPATQFAQGASEVEFNVQKDGWLFMGVEDLLNFDNSGEMNVAVTIY